MGDALAPWHIILLVVVLLVLFGSRRLPGAAKSLGESMHIFKRSVAGLHDEPVDAAGAAAGTGYPPVQQLAAQQLTAQPLAGQPPVAAQPQALAQQQAATQQQQLADLQRQLAELQRQAAGGAGNGAGAPAETQPGQQPR